MAKLSPAQTALLTKAAARDDGAILPPPDGLALNPGALARVLRSLARRGLIQGDGDDDVLTDAGYRAVGTEPPVVGTADTVGATGTDTPPPLAGGVTKQARLVDLLRRPGGATLDEITADLDWQPHSVRGAISGTIRRKLGLTVDSHVEDGRGRVYRIAEAG